LSRQRAETRLPATFVLGTAVVAFSATGCEIQAPHAGACRIGRQGQPRLALAQGLIHVLAGKGVGEDLCEHAEPPNQRVRPDPFRRHGVEGLFLGLSR
jgi:hypothetical protein